MSPMFHSGNSKPSMHFYEYMYMQQYVADYTSISVPFVYHTNLNFVTIGPLP